MYIEQKQRLYAIPQKTWGDVEHHGIKGQKWGVRNGPPYPLDSSKSTGKRLKETKGGVKKKDKKNKSLKNYGYGFRPFEDDPAFNYNHLIKTKDTSTEARLKRIEEADLLTGQSKDKKRLEEAAKLGIRARNVLWPGDDADPNNPSDREWFIYEDQTIGYATIADLVRRGKSKEEIESLIDDAKNLSDEYPYTDGIFQLDYLGHYEPGNRFLNACKNVTYVDNIQENKKSIANDIAEELIADMKRWKDQGDSNVTIPNKEEFVSRVQKRIDEVQPDDRGFYEHNNNSFTFNINGFKDYSDYAPLIIEYDPKKKKASVYDYL